MSGLEGVAAALAAVLAGLFAWSRRGRAGRPAAGRWTKFLLWVAIASPLVVLLVPPEDRPRVFVRGRAGAFEALRVLAFAAAAAGAVGSLPAGPRRAWSAALLVLAASVSALAACLLLVMR